MKEHIALLCMIIHSVAVPGTTSDVYHSQTEYITLPYKQNTTGYFPFRRENIL